MLQRQEVVALAERMQRELEVRDRHWRLRKYRACFVGRDAVRWMMNTAAVAPSEEDAVALGNAMLQLGLIAHVVRTTPPQHNHHGRCRAISKAKYSALAQPNPRYLPLASVPFPGNSSRCGAPFMTASTP